MKNVNFKMCILSDISFSGGLLTFSVSTKGFKRYSTGAKRVREILECTFHEHTASMLYTEFLRADTNSLDDDHSLICRGGHSYFNGVICKYVCDFYYSSAEHLKDDTYVNSMLCVFSVYLKEDTILSDVLLPCGILSALFSESDSDSDTIDSDSDTIDSDSDTIDSDSDTIDSDSDTIDSDSDTSEYAKNVKEFVFYARKHPVVKPVSFSSSFLEVRTGGEYPFKIVLSDGSEIWDCRSRPYNEYLSDLIGAPPYDELPF